MAVAFTQVSARGRNDDGTQVTATWKAATGTNWTQRMDVPLRVRFDCSETGTTAATLAGQLQCNLNGGAFQAVNASSTIVKAVAGANSIDGVATTQQISSGTFVAGSCDAADGLCATTASIAQNSHTELEYCIQFVSANMSAGSTVQLRVVRSTATAFGTYTFTPTVQISANPATTALSFSPRTSALKLALHPATTALMFTGLSSTITMGTRLVATAASLSFSVVTSALKLKINPGTTALAFSALTSPLKLKLNASTTNLTFAAVQSVLKMAVHPSSVALIFTAQSSHLKSTIASGSTGLLFASGSATLKLAMQPSSVAMHFLGLQSIVTNTGGSPAVIPVSDVRIGTIGFAMNGIRVGHQ